MLRWSLHQYNRLFDHNVVVKGGKRAVGMDGKAVGSTKLCIKAAFSVAYVIWAIQNGNRTRCRS